MERDELCYLTVAQAASLIGRRELSSVELTQACCERIAELEPRLHAFITPTLEQALEEAWRADQEITSGRYRGSLHGIPFGLKDLYHTQGIRTTAGSIILADFVPQEDATCVARLRDAGAILLGKLNLYEFAYGATGRNPYYETPRNPWGEERLPGGSSSGSGVALAAGMLPAATGSDTGGSIRIPASLCGVVGLKPTYGRVSRRGIIPLAWSLDHAGPMARSVEDCALLLQAMAGHDPRDPGSSREPIPDFTAGLRAGVRSLRIGLPQGHWSLTMQEAVRQRVTEAVSLLQEMGAQVREIDEPSQEMLRGTGPIIGCEALAYHVRWLKERPQDYSPEVRQRLEGNLGVPAVDYIRAQQARAQVIDAFRQAMEEVDLLVLPTEPITAPRIGQTTVVLEGQEAPAQGLLTRFTRAFNQTGLPAISLPCGFDDAGLPVGLQIVGKPFQEALVLQAAYAYEQATGWHTRRPSM